LIHLKIVPQKIQHTIYKPEEFIKIKTYENYDKKLMARVSTLGLTTSTSLSYYVHNSRESKNGDLNFQLFTACPA